MLSIDEAIEDFKTMVKDARGEIIHGDDLEPQEKYYNSQLESYVEEKEQIAEWLEELKVIKEMDLSIPQHFTKEQSDWIKEYCINRNKEFYNKAIDNFVHECDNHCGFYKGESKNITREDILKIAEQLKG